MQEEMKEEKCKKRAEENAWVSIKKLTRPLSLSHVFLLSVFFSFAFFLKKKTKPKGLAKSQEAIENAIGDPKACKLDNAEGIENFWVDPRSKDKRMPRAPRAGSSKRKASASRGNDKVIFSGEKVEQRNKCDKLPILPAWHPLV